MSDLEEFPEQPRPEDDGIVVRARPTRITTAGDEYTGEWSPIDKRHGFGKCMIAAGAFFYEGYWKDD